MTPDLGKFADVLKAAIYAGAFHKLAVAIAAGLCWYVARTKFIPQAEPWEFWAFAIAVFFAFLFIADIFTAILKTVPLKRWTQLWLAQHREKRDVKNYIPFMTRDERQIIGYLLFHNRKMFTAESDGGYASTLISRGIVRIMARHNQHFNFDAVTFGVPEPAWEVLMRHKAQFPYEPPNKPGEVEVQPWRIPWMAR